MTTSLYIPTQDEIDHAAEQMTVRYTADAKRIGRAAQLVAAGAVEYAGEQIGWSVASQRTAPITDPNDPTPWRYTVSATSCSCPDHMLRLSAVGNCGDHEIAVRAACKHIYAVQMYLRIIAARLDAAIKDQAAPVDVVESATNGLYIVFDRTSGEAICSAVYVTRTDAYRPETGDDAAEFARWLGNQPVAVDLRFPGGLLEKVLRTAAGESLTLRADVIYGEPRMYTLIGYRFQDQKWIHLEREEHQQFNEQAWNVLLDLTGWELSARPVKQPGLAYHYLLRRKGSTPDGAYALGAMCQDYADRKRMNRMFEVSLSHADDDDR